MAKAEVYAGIDERWPIINAWIAANAALVAGGGERELSVLQANIMAFVPPKDRMFKELECLQAEIEEQRLKGEYPTDAPRDWRIMQIEILLRAAQRNHLFTFEKIKVK